LFFSVEIGAIPPAMGVIEVNQPLLKTGCIAASSGIMLFDLLEDRCDRATDK
jgi:hypothetical protein